MPSPAPIMSRHCWPAPPPFASLFLGLLLVVAQHAPLEAPDAAAAGHHPARHQRCRLTRGRWCGSYHAQQPLPAKLAPAYGKQCSNGCSGVGVCNAMTGQCDCPAGWGGRDCSEELKRPCTDDRNTYRGPGTAPSSHIGPDKRDINWTQGEWSASRCAGICDDNRGLCYCDPSQGGAQPVPGTAQAAEPQGASLGRPLSEYCQPQTTADGQPAWGRMQYENIYGSLYGWCTAAVGVEPAVSCGCTIDGRAGKWCESLTEQVCPNSCSGHGRCDGGSCLCEQGWFGHDCAGRVEGQQPEGFNESKALVDRPWLAGHLVPPAAAAQPRPGQTRKRPLIFVYDSPAWAATRMLQYRGTKQSCTWRWFDEGNTTQLNTNWVYAAETLLHEMLLASPHRTMDPEEADLFYVPAYVACYAWPVLGFADYPYYYSAGGPRVSHLAKMLLELKQHIQQTYPYWNRTNGRDHVWLAPHDEGACWFPTDIYNSSIILTHWGRMGAHESNTAFAADNYSSPWVDPAHKDMENVSWTELIRGHPCYTPGKDLVIPSPKFPAHYRWSPLLGAPAQQRDTLLYFRGDVGADRKPNYSRGIRQRLHALARTSEWREQLGVRIGTREELPGDYSRALASSIFCLVAPGDGWSGRAEDAVLHGCIPAIVQDGVHAPFESVLDYEAFSVRVAEQQVDRLPHILAAIPDREVRQMQHNLRRVWHRFAYLSQPLLRDSAAGIRQQWQQQQQAGPHSAIASAQQQQEGRRLAQQAGPGSSQQDPGASDPPAVDASGGDASSSSSSSSSSSGAKSGLGPLGMLLSHLQGIIPQGVNRARRQRPGAAVEGPFELSEQHIKDDAFGTILQWLYARSLQLQHRHSRHHARPSHHAGSPAPGPDSAS